MTLALSFFKAPSVPSVFSELNAKNFKISTSHDGAQLTEFELLIGKTKIGRVYEDDWSGCIMLSEVSADALKAFDEYRTEADIEKFISEECSGNSDREWALITIHSMFQDINNYKPVTRKAAKFLMVGTPNRHLSVSWPGRKLEDISTSTLHNEIPELVAAAKQQKVPETLLNTPEQLKRLGVKFTQKE